MRRRDFIKIIGSAVACPLVARAQPAGAPVVGFIGTELPETYAARLRAFHEGLKEIGFVEGQNVAIEYRWAQSQYARLSELAADLVRRRVAVIAATGGEPAPQSAMAATQTIPIVFTAAGDVVRGGLVASLNRPGGNATGITIFGSDAVAKRMQLMHELMPRATVVAFLMNPDNPNSDVEILGTEILVLGARNEDEIDKAFATLGQQKINALVAASDTFFYSRRHQLFSLAGRHSIAAIYHAPAFAQDGGLMGYGNSLTELYRLVGVYVGRILKGEKKIRIADQPQNGKSARPDHSCSRILYRRRCSRINRELSAIGPKQT
jgi:putative ABC transport system substrate-binding protein